MAATEQQDWVLDDGTEKLAGEIQLRSYSKFISGYSQQLADLETALGSYSLDAWDRHLDPISLDTSPHERTSLLDLINTENKVLNKIIIALSSLCLEVQHLEKEAKEEFYDALLFYGEGVEIKEEDGTRQSQIGRLLPLLQRLSSFVTRGKEVLKNMILQLAALHNKTMPKVMEVGQIHFTTVFESIGALLRIMITLDEIVAANTVLKNQWIQYKVVLKSVYQDPSKYGVDADKIKPFEKMLARIERQILDGKILDHCWLQNYDDTGIPVSKNTLFAEEFATNIKIIFGNVEPRIGDGTETNQRLQYVELCALFALHVMIFRDLDKRLFRQLWDVYKKLPCVVLTSNVIWFADEFLKRFAGKAIDKKMSDQVTQSRLAYLNSKQQSLPREAQSYFLTVSSWLVKMESIQTQDKSTADLNNKVKILLEGIYLSFGLSNMVSQVMNLHAAMQKPMSRSEVLALCRIMGLAKAIEDSFHRCAMQVMENEQQMVQHLQYQILAGLQMGKRRIVVDKKYSDRRLDILSAIMLASNSINGPPTAQRILVTKLAISIADQMRVFKDEELGVVKTMIDRLIIFGNSLKSSIRRASDFSFFYWHRAVLGIFFDGVCQDPTDAGQMPYMFSVLNDCVPHIRRSKHVENTEELVKHYSEDVIAILKQNLLVKVCKEIENDLRLSVHTHLKLDDRNPYKVGLKGLRQLLSIKPLHFLNQMIDIKDYVSHYIDTTFYNLTTVALHDWRTYGEMRNLAVQKYQLRMQEVHLPNQTLEQGLDVLEIMRNIHVFVSKYLYNLNNQIFVEKSSNNKHLNTINIRHVANSVRTHGTGIMNTTVNFTFQFLKKKFYIFSQFLYDEHIKSRLIKDIRNFKENRVALGQRYPYDRADRFNKGIRKLGLSPEGQSYLDQFRLLVSHIGNAMGYVRMVRSGGIHYCSDAIRFVPDLDDIVSFNELVQEENIGDEVNEAASHLDTVIDTLSKNSAEGSDYFTKLVDVFSQEFRSQKNMHLRNFYAILPPLTLNFVEHSISCKEKMNKKNKQGAAFTDDGFAMGVAYILKLLDQYKDFDSLHWFQSVKHKHEEDMKSQKKDVTSSSKKQQSSSNITEDEKLLQATSLALKRILIYQREFELLYFSLSSARIFFRGNKSDDDGDEKPSEDTTQDNANNSGNESTTQQPPQPNS
uniref:WASH complex subunit 4-like n=1 Tax=Styela clava TaxID=7725 RepID=UPI001939FC80|nr:WASH complex subunit 4-like [Styela clava]